MPILPNAQNVATRQLADKSKIVDHEARYDPRTGEKHLKPIYAPAGSCFDEPPAPEIKFSPRILDRWEKRGFVTVEGKRPMHFPGGPNGTHGRDYDPWRRQKDRTETWCDRITFHCKKYGELVYEVVFNPGKYYVSDDAPVTAETVGPSAGDPGRYAEPTYALWEYHCRRVDQG